MQVSFRACTYLNSYYAMGFRQALFPTEPVHYTVELMSATILTQSNHVHNAGCASSFCNMN